MNEIIDGRRGAFDHLCSGTWRYEGLTLGGHEYYSCDSENHDVVSLHWRDGINHACADYPGSACMAMAGGQIPAAPNLTAGQIRALDIALARVKHLDGPDNGTIHAIVSLLVAAKRDSGYPPAP